MGKPLIVSNRGGLPELVEDGVNGYIFDGKAQELADRICQMQMLSKEQYIQMGRTSLEKAQGLFDAKAYIKQIESYYIESKTRKGFQS